MEFTRDGTNWIECGSFDTSENLYDHACLENNASIQNAKGVRVALPTRRRRWSSQVAAMKPTGTQNASDRACMACVEDGGVPVWDGLSKR